MAVYPLATTALGSGHEYNVQACNHFVAWRTYHSHGASVPVSLTPHPTGWHVIGPAGFLGVLGKDVQEKYADISRIWESGHTPNTRVWLSPALDGKMRVRVQLANPAFIVPYGRTNSRAQVLDQGSAHPLELQQPFEHTVCLLVDLIATGERVVATYNDHLLGAITHPDPRLLHAVRTRTLSARAFLAQGHAALDISPYLTSSDIPVLNGQEPEWAKETSAYPESDVVTLHTEAIELIDPSKKI